MQVAQIRRYRCRGCGVVLTVVPSGVARRYHFCAGAIALALFLFGAAKQRAAEAVAAVGSASSGQGGWRTLRRWLGAIEAGRLFASVRAAPAAWPPRRRAEQVAYALAALVPAGLEDDQRAKVFAGAARAARIA